MHKPMKRILLCCSTVFLLSASHHSIAQTDYTTIINNITPTLKTVSGTSIANTATGYMNTQNTDGSWPDITYASGAAGNIPFNTHLTRLFQYAQAYTINTSPLFGNTNLYTHLSAALQYWNNHIPANNWWYDQISYPQLLGQTLVLMRGGSQALSAADSTGAMNYLASRDNPSVQTGANRVDEALHWLYRGALTANASVINTSITQAGSTLNLVASGVDGINHDYAFLQHGPELMTMSYGTVLLSAAYKIANYIKGTSYSFSTTQMQNAYTFLHHSFNGAVRGKYKDFSLTGRGISRGNELGQNQSVTIQAMQADTDAGHDAALKEDSLRLSGARVASYNITQPYHIHYWTSDYTLHNRPAYSYSVRSVSTRTARSESINGENLLGTFLTEGANNIRVNGNEYYNIFPVWDWKLVPGVTMRQFATPQTNPNGCCNSNGAYNGNQSYVGGVSDSSYGCSANYMNYYNVTAKKAWFFFDDEIVNLGAGITSTSAETVATSVNQCLLDGNIAVNSAGSISTLGAQTQSTYSGNLQWALHDSVGYFFPAGGTVKLSNQTQTGSWSIINTGGASTSINKNVCKIWMDHGTTPTNAGYAYIVVPGVTTTTQMSAYNAANITIITNTVSYQAVKHEGWNMLQAIIRATGGGTITDPASGFKITVDQPCAVLVKNIGGATVTVSIADPAQAATTINVGITFPGSTTVIPTPVTMPTGNYKGASVSFQVVASYPYCLGTGGTDGTDRFITSLGTTGASHNISYTNSSYPSNGYGRYTADTIRVAKGSSFTLNMTNSTATEWSRVKVYANWAGNNDFISVGDTILSLGAANQDNSATVLTISSSIMVPVTATTGTTRMRVRFYDATASDPGPCDQANYTTTQDFVLTITPPASPDSIIAVADAYVRNGTYATNNFGTATSLVVKNDAGVNYARQTYLKFDLQNVTRPVSGAKLRLYLSYAGATANTVQWVLNGCATDSWTETGINWNNKPAAGSQVATTPGQTTAGYVEWDITVAVNASTDDLLTLQLVSSATGGTTDASFWSKEIATIAYKPVIKFDYTPLVADSISVTADAYVKSGSGDVNTNFGTQGYLAAQSGFYESYLRFDAHALPVNTITAKLKLYSLAGAATDWQLYRVTDNSWTEAGINWNNKPAVSNLLATISAPASAGYVYWDILSGLQNNMPTDSLVSFKIVASSNVYSSFASKQAITVNQRPVIVFEVPEQQGASLVLNELGSSFSTNQDLSSFDLYPNPVITSCRIQSKRNIRRIAIYDARGAIVKNITGLNSSQYNLGLDDLKAGFYTISVNGEGWQGQRKITKQ
ncbi:MAG: polysaccharide lyase family 8 super-sandwich domain-containing protein [Bacteroidota bacterium]